MKSSYVQLEQHILYKFSKESFANLTSIQQQSYRVLARRRDSLIVAPTGSGKTESAIIPVITMLADDKYDGSADIDGIRCLYVTPQRSLNNDVFRRIIKYATSENLKVEIRHGDTSYTKRKNLPKSA